MNASCLLQAGHHNFIDTEETASSRWAQSCAPDP